MLKKIIHKSCECRHCQGDHEVYIWSDATRRRSDSSHILSSMDKKKKANATLVKKSRMNKMTYFSPTLKNLLKGN